MARIAVMETGEEGKTVKEEGRERKNGKEEEGEKIERRKGT